MKIVVLGADGYIGYPLTHSLDKAGHDVVAVDNEIRRVLAEKSVTPIKAYRDRMTRLDVTHLIYDLKNPHTMDAIMKNMQPDVVVNLAQIPSAPFSMSSRWNSWETQHNNVKVAHNLHWAIEKHCPEAHVVQLATMGEYGTPDQPIPEGFLDDGRPAPKMPGSFYHVSKAMMTLNAQFVARTWGHRITEIYQGIVYGLGPGEVLTRFDVDGQFGTVLNRFTAQAAIMHPLTVYGDGGQKRAMLPLTDSIECIKLLIENPPSREGPGRYPYRAVNQFAGSHRVKELAEMVADYTGAEIRHTENIRGEDTSEHYYEPERRVLDKLGYEPSTTIEDEFERTYDMIVEYSDRIDRDVLMPETRWKK